MSSTTIKTVNINRPVQTRQVLTPSTCASLGWYDAWAVKKVKVIKSSEYDTESRPRPENLLSALTTRTEVYRYSSACQVKRKLVGSSCKYYTYTYVAPRDLPSQRTAQLLATPPATYWETKLRNAIKDVSVNLGASTFEARETYKMFRDGANALVSGWKNLRKGHVFSRRITPCDIASAELVGSFGINPLLGELYDSVDKLQRSTSESITRRIKVKARSEATREWTPPTQAGTIWSRVNRYHTAVCYVTFDRDVPDFIMGNPAEVAWELTPFSWLIDGFISVGEYLSAFDALKYVDSLKGTLTVRDKYLVRDNLKYYSDTAEVVRPGRVSGGFYARSVFTDIPFPTLPGFSLSRSWRKLMHATSALVQMTKPCPKSPWRSNRPFVAPKTYPKPRPRRLT